MEETGFYHPERGYWQVIGEPTQNVLDTYPSGTVQVPLKPAGNHVWSGNSWVQAAPDLAALAAEVRLKRNELLSSSDWTQVSDAPVNQAAWATYRQALRDIPQQAGFPSNVVWPEKP